MKKNKLKSQIFSLFIIALLTAATLLVTVIFGNTQSAGAYYLDYSENGSTTFYYERFDVTFDVSADRKLSVREELTVKFTGYDSTGFLRDIPVNGGEIVRNVKVKELVNGEETGVYYKVETYEDDRGTDYITANIGDYAIKTNETHTYVLTYDYCLTEAQEGENRLAVNAIGPQDRRVESSTIKFILPEGLKTATYVLGVTGFTGREPINNLTSDNGRIIAIVDNVSLAYNEGITFDFVYEDGVLSTYFDFTPYWFVIAIAALIIIMIILKFTVFGNRSITPVVNFEAPDNMDPLMMGKLIDNTVDTEDISSMIFYWADKGYLKINMDDQQNPELLRMVQFLPESCPDYEKMLFAGLFGKRDFITPKLIPARFHNDVQAVISRVNKKAKNFYEKKSVIASIVFSAIAAVIMVIAPLVFTLSQISLRFDFFGLLVPVFFAFPLLIIYGMSRVIKDRSVKYKEKPLTNIAVFAGAIILIVLAVVVFYSIFVPVGTLNLLPKALIVISTCAVTALSPMIITRTKEYNDKLGQIVGFRNFIKLAEKDRLEKLIEDNPQFYYHILPYAQVLNVSDVWEDKFESIALPPPSYVTYSRHNAMRSMMEFHIINQAFRSLSRSVSNKIIPPSSSGGSGRGGFSGGHSGGGHGGGGSRGR